MRQPRILLTLSCLLLPLSISLVSASLDSSPSNDTIADSTGNGSGNGNGNLNADNDEHQNYNKNYNAQSNKYSNQELNTNINFLNTENNNYNFFENDEDDDDHDDHDHGHGHGHDGKDLNGPEVVYTTEIVSTLTTYCPDATVLEQNGNRYTITEAGTITITDCPCTLSHALPGIALTPAILPQPASSGSWFLGASASASAVSLPTAVYPPSGTGTGFVDPSIVTASLIPGATGVGGSERKGEGKGVETLGEGGAEGQGEGEEGRDAGPLQFYGAAGRGMVGVGGLAGVMAVVFVGGLGAWGL